MMTCPKCHNVVFIPKKISSYFLLEPIGAGGMGSVYRGVSTRFPGRSLAIKVLSRVARENPPDIMGLLNEARISSRFQNCEFIASCLDSGFAEEEYFSVMDCITGERLDKMIERLHQIPEKEVLTITLHVLAAEQHIYRNGYLFRDLKPENIIITPKGYAVLLDFGLCIPREIAAQPSNDAFVTGSPYYLPPERLLCTGENAASELYSLGMIMYHALRGQTYYDAGEAQDLAKRHLSTLRLNSSVKLEGIRPSLAALISEMIRQNRSERPQDFLSVAQKIKEILKEIG